MDCRWSVCCDAMGHGKSDRPTSGLARVVPVEVDPGHEMDISVFSSCWIFPSVFCARRVALNHSRDWLLAGRSSAGPNRTRRWEVSVRLRRGLTACGKRCMDRQTIPPVALRLTFNNSTGSVVRFFNVRDFIVVRVVSNSKALQQRTRDSYFYLILPPTLWITNAVTDAMETFVRSAKH
jgi:hypothetical protein